MERSVVGRSIAVFGGCRSSRRWMSYIVPIDNLEEIPILLTMRLN